MSEQAQYVNSQRPFFVYGTLKRGHGNATIIDSQLQSRFNGSVKGYTLYNGPGFPYIVPSDDDSVVYGEICMPYEHHYDRVMSLLDALEGVPHHYTREIVEVLTEILNVPIKCYMYVANTSEDSVVQLGDVIKDGVW